MRVTDNFSDSADMSAFWQRMTEARRVWLRDAKGQAITPQQLPERLGLQQLEDDAYRSLVYFTREVGYAKPRQQGGAPAFLEFYWADWLRSVLPLDDYDLTDRSDYRDAILAAAKRMVSLAADEVVGDSGFSARQLGVYTSVDRKELAKVAGRKLSYATAYRQERQAGR